MVEIKEVPDGFEVAGNSYRELFQTKFKAIMAAHVIAYGEAAESGHTVRVIVPMGWGEAIIVHV